MLAASFDTNVYHTPISGAKPCALHALDQRDIITPEQEGESYFNLDRAIKHALLDAPELKKTANTFQTPTQNSQPGKTESPLLCKSPAMRRFALFTSCAFSAGNCDDDGLSSGSCSPACLSTQSGQTTPDLIACSPASSATSTDAFGSPMPALFHASNFDTAFEWPDAISIFEHLHLPHSPRKNKTKHRINRSNDSTLSLASIGFGSTRLGSPSPIGLFAVDSASAVESSSLPSTTPMLRISSVCTNSGAGSDQHQLLYQSPLLLPLGAFGNITVSDAKRALVDHLHLDNLLVDISDVDLLPQLEDEGETVPLKQALSDETLLYTERRCAKSSTDAPTVGPYRVLVRLSSEAEC